MKPVCVPRSYLMAFAVGTFGIPGMAESADRILELNATIRASLDDVWSAWTTADGVTAFGPEAAAIELKIGGKYEWYFSMDAPPGLRGAEGCTVLAFVPHEMIAFTWNAPPSIPTLREAEARTQVVVRMAQQSGDQVVVTLTQHGFGNGNDWDQYYEYFSNAWPRVLERQKSYLESKAAASGGQATAPKPPAVTTNKNVRVLLYDQPIKWQDFHIELPVSAEDAWHFIADAEGLNQLYDSHAKVELKPGGTYAIWPNSVQTILAHLPGAMLAGTGSAPPKFPNVRKGGTWFAYRFESVDSNRSLLKLALLGWHEHDGVEWDRAFDYFVCNNAVFLNDVHRRIDKIVSQNG